MEKDYVPKHTPVEKKAPAKAPAPQQKKDTAQQKPAVPNTSSSSTAQKQTPAGDTKQIATKQTQGSTSATKNVVTQKTETHDTKQTPTSKDTKAPTSNTSHQEKTSDTSAEKKEEPKKAPQKVTKKDFAMARAIGLAASKKYCMYICEFIKGKTIDQSLKELNEVLVFKRAIPMRGEIPHRSQPGIMSGRYPIKVTAQFITMLKGLRGNALVNGMDIHKTIITMGSASWGSRPAKRGGMRFKRTNVTLRAEEKK